MKNRIILYGLLLLLASCVKMNDNIKEYMDRGEINYIGKVDSASTAGGKERILFTWKANNDPRIEQCWIYWNNMRDSASFPVSPAALDENGYMSAIPAIPEGTYVFNMYHTGAKGYRSVPQEVTGRSYGELYRSTLIPRSIGIIEVGEDNAVVNLAASGETEIRTEIVYESESGEMKIQIVLPDERQATITDHKDQGTLSTVSYYRPEPDSPDDFPSDASATKTFPKYMPVHDLDKTGWTIWANTEEVVEEYALAVYLIDDDVDTYWHSRYDYSVGPYPLPHIIIIDMKQVAFIDDIQLMRRNPNGVNYVDFETSMDGEQWTPIGSFDFIQIDGRQGFNIQKGFARYLKIIIPDKSPQGQYTNFREVYVVGYYVEE